MVTRGGCGGRHVSLDAALLLHCAWVCLHCTQQDCIVPGHVSISTDRPGHQACSLTHTKSLPLQHKKYSSAIQMGSCGGTCPVVLFCGSPLSFRLLTITPAMLHTPEVPNHPLWNGNSEAHNDNTAFSVTHDKMAARTKLRVGFHNDHR